MTEDRRRRTDKKKAAIEIRHPSAVVSSLQELVEHSSVGSLQRVRSLNLDEFRSFRKSVEIRLLLDGKTAHSLHGYH